MPKSDWVAPARRVSKPWGWESHFALVDGKYCGKVLHVEAGHALSLQYHEHKDETISIHSGRLLFEVGSQGSRSTGSNSDLASRSAYLRAPSIG